MKKILLFVILIFTVTLLNSQSVSQMSFVIKKSVTNVKSIIILVSEKNKDKALKQAKMAQVITKIPHSVFPIANKMKLSKMVSNNILKKKDVVVLVFTDDKLFDTESIKSISSKLNTKKIPLFTNRDKDTLVGAMIAIFKKDGSVEKHVNMITASALGIEIPKDFLAKCVIDVE